MTDEADTLEDRLARLESVIEDQQETIEQQSDRIEELEAGDGSDETDTGGLPVSRRTAMQTGGVLGLLGLGAGAAGAQGTGNIGTPSSPLEAVYTASLDGPLASDTVNVIAGNGLDINNNELEVDAGTNLSFGEGGVLHAASQSEWEVGSSYYLSPIDDTVHSVDLEGRMLYDTSTESELYHPTYGLRSHELDRNSITINSTSVELGGTRVVEHSDLPDVAVTNHHTHGSHFTLNGDSFDIVTDSLAGAGLTVDAEDRLEVTSSGSAAWVEGDAQLEPANPANYSSVDLGANDLTDGTTTIYDESVSAVPGGVIADNSVTNAQLANLGSISIDELTGGVVTDPVNTLDGLHLAVDPETNTFDVDSASLAGEHLNVNTNDALAVDPASMAGTGLVGDARSIAVDTSAEGSGSVARAKITYDGDGITTINGAVNISQVSTQRGQIFDITLDYAVGSTDPYVTVVTPITRGPPGGDFAGSIEWGLEHAQDGDNLMITVYFSRGLDATDSEGFQFATHEAQ